MSEHAGNCGYVQKGVPCDCGLWEQSATLFKHQERIRQLEALAEWCRPDEHSPPEHWAAYLECYPESAPQRGAEEAIARTKAKYPKTMAALADTHDNKSDVSVPQKIFPYCKTAPCRPQSPCRAPYECFANDVHRAAHDIAADPAATPEQRELAGKIDMLSHELYAAPQKGVDHE